MNQPWSIATCLIAATAGLVSAVMVIDRCTPTKLGFDNGGVYLGILLWYTSPYLFLCGLAYRRRNNRSLQRTFLITCVLVGGAGMACLADILYIKPGPLSFPALVAFPFYQFLAGYFIALIFYRGVRKK